MKRIAKSRPDRLASAVAAAAASARRTVAGRTRIRPAQARGYAPRTRTTHRAGGAALETCLVPAHAGHFEWIAGLLREGAARGSFDPELATDSLGARLFFENLRNMLATGYFLSEREDAAAQPTSASGYVFMVTRSGDAPVPVGCALFKSIGDLGFELWLCVIESRFRGRGLCSAMLAAARQTPAGMLAHIARVNRSGRDRAAICKALERTGYRAAHDGPNVRWFVRDDAPEALVRLVRKAALR